MPSFRSRVEKVAEVSSSVASALTAMDGDTSRLILAPDCGLGFLTESLAKQKLTAMVAAAKAVQ